jgi:hypothetical protein
LQTWILPGKVNAVFRVPFFTLMLQLLMGRWEFLKSDELIHTESIDTNSSRKRSASTFPSNAKEGQEENSGSQGTSRTEGQNRKSMVLLTTNRQPQSNQKRRQKAARNVAVTTTKTMKISTSTVSLHSINERY